MKKHYKILKRACGPLLLALCAANTCFAQKDSDSLRLSSLGQALELAVKQNPTAAIYGQQISQARYNFKASKSFILPNASAGFNGTDNLSIAVTPVPGELFGQPGTTIYAKFGRQYVYNTGITLNETVFNWTSVMQAKIAGSNLKMSELQQIAYLQSLKEQVARYYYSAQIAKTALKIIAQDELLGDSVVNLTKQRLDEGSTDLISLNVAKINLNSILQNKGQSQQLYDQSIENLKIFLGGKPENSLTINDDLQPDGMTSSLPVQIGTDHTLDAYKQQVLIADEQRRSQRSMAYPTIAASAFFGDQQFRSDFGLSFGNSAWSTYNYIGLTINIPIFTGFSNHYKYKSAVVQKVIAEQQYDNAVQQSSINDRLTLKNCADYQLMVKASGASFKLYGDNLKLDAQKYAEGVISLDTYQKAIQDYLTSENTYLNNLSMLLSTLATVISRQ